MANANVTAVKPYRGNEQEVMDEQFLSLDVHIWLDAIYTWNPSARSELVSQALCMYMTTVL